MRTIKVTLSVLLLVALGAFPGAAAAAPAPAHSTSDHSVSNPDGTVIYFTLFKPAGASAARRAPVVLHSHGWGGSRATEIGGTVEDLLNAGMGVVSFDQRGHGESTGQAHVQDPTRETEDVKLLIDFIARLPWVAHDRDARGRVIRNDPVLGAIGGSYGGGYQTMTALDEIADEGRTRFNALAPEITWYDLPQSLAPNKVVRSAWNAVLYAAGAANVPQYIHEAFAWGSVSGQWPDGTVLDRPVAGVPDIDSTFHDHSPVAFVQKGIRINVPVMFRQGITDNLFNLNEGLSIFNKALTPAARAKSYFVGYNGGHALPNVLPAGTGGGTIATEGDACSGPSDFSGLTIKFFKRVFSGASTKGLLPSRYSLTTADDSSCVRGNRFRASKPISVPGPAGDIVAMSGAGAPLQLEVASGPMTVAGIPKLTGTVTTAGLDGRAFFGLAVGSSPADARVVANNLMPMRRALPVSGEAFEMELTGVSVVVPEGQHLYLTIAPMSDLFFGHGSRTPAGWVLSDLQLTVPRLAR